MDESGQAVSKFLEKFQQLNRTIYHELYNRFINRGAKHAKRIPLNLSGTPFRIHDQGNIAHYSGALVSGVHVVPLREIPEIWLTITVLWDKEKFFVTTEIETEGNEMTLFHAFPVRIAETLEKCLYAIDMAGEDLLNYSDVVIRELL